MFTEELSQEYQVRQNPEPASRCDFCGAALPQLMLRLHLLQTSGAGALASLACLQLTFPRWGLLGKTVARSTAAFSVALSSSKLEGWREGGRGAPCTGELWGGGHSPAASRPEEGHGLVVTLEAQWLFCPPLH